MTRDEEHAPDHEQRSGLLYGFGAYAIWGLVPLYWPLLDPAGPLEVLAHRMVWSLGVVAIALACTRRWAWIRDLVRQPSRVGLLVLAAATITVNWGVYIWAVDSGHVVEASLGYFINPLVTILLGVVLLKERLRPGQWAAVGIGFAAVVVISVGYGRLPWISLVLAFSFGTYGLIKKKVELGGLESLAAETTVLFLPALGFLLWLGATGASTFTTHGAGHAAWLSSAGLVTAVPLVLFGASAVRVPLTTLGLLQYLTPVIQLALGVAYFHEPMPPERLVGFALVWVALIVLTWDALRTARGARARAERLRAAAGPAGDASPMPTPTTPARQPARPAQPESPAAPSDSDAAGNRPGA